MREPFWLIALVMLLICAIVAAITFPIAEALSQQAQALGTNKDYQIFTLKLFPPMLFVFGLVAEWLANHRKPKTAV